MTPELYPVAFDGIGTPMVAMEVFDPDATPKAIRESLAATGLGGDGVALGTVIEILTAALSFGVPVVLGLANASDDTVTALTDGMDAQRSVLLWANLPTRDDFLSQLMALPGLTNAIYVYAGPRAALSFGHKAVTETDADGKVIGILAYFERPGRTPQLSMAIEPEHRRGLTYSRLVAKASAEWGVDVLALVARLAETDPHTFSAESWAIWEKHGPDFPRLASRLASRYARQAGNTDHRDTLPNCN